jgi:hypothetical protein
VLGHPAAVPPAASDPSASGSGATLASIEEYATDDLDKRSRLVLRGLAAFGRAFVEHKRQEVEDDPDALTPGGAAGWDALGMIFRSVPPVLLVFLPPHADMCISCRIGGVSAAVSAWICYKMWRERVLADRRAKAAARGYRIGG